MTVDRKGGNKVKIKISDKPEACWVIMQRSYEYNDETYDMHEGGNTIVAYTDYDKALAALEQKMIESVKCGQTYMYYGYSAGSYFNDSCEFSEMLERYGISFDDLDDYSKFNEFVEALENANDEDIKLFIEHLENPLYYLERVEIG